MKWLKIISFVTILCLCSSCDKQESAENTQAGLQLPEEETAIRELLQSHTKAMNNRDVNALADFWSDEAIYRNPLTGTLVQGKEEIKTEFKKIFDKLGDATIELEVKSISFPFEDKAAEEGVARLLRPGEAPIESEQKFVFVKREGKWLLLNASSLDLGTLNQTP